MYEGDVLDAKGRSKQHGKAATTYKIFGSLRSAFAMAMRCF